MLTNNQADPRPPEQTQASEPQRVPIFERTWMIILFLLFCFPIGLILMWVKARWSIGAKVAVTISIFFLAIASMGNETNETKKKPTVNTTLPAGEAAVSKSASASQATAEEQAYSIKVASLLGNWAAGSKSMLQLCEEAGKTPELIFNDAWKIQMAAAMALIKQGNDHLNEIRPPARFKVAHRELKKVARHQEKAIALLTDGIDSVDDKKLLRGFDEIEKGSAALKKANALILKPTN